MPASQSDRGAQAPRSLRAVTHAAPADALRGLTSQEAAERSAQGLANSQPTGTSRTLWAIVRSNALTFFNGVVLAAFSIFLVLGRWQDALFGLTALANGVIGVSQEYRAKRTLDRLRIVNAPMARVLRDGREAELPAEEVVLDDLLTLRAGDQVTADAEILAAREATVDESLLTGESEPVVRGPGERLLSGSTLVGGSAVARVTAVGEAATASRLAVESRRFSLVRSELRESLDRLLSWIAWAVLPLGALVLNAQMEVQGGWPAALAEGRWRTAAVDTAAAIIAMIPLGLVLMTSVAFAVGAVRLAREQVLVQELPAVEGLARVDALCIDKTGTLTGRDLELDGVYPALARPVPDEAWAAALGWFAAEPGANPTVRCLAQRFPPPAGVDAALAIDFSSARKWSAATLDGPAAGTWVLGAPEMVAGLPGFLPTTTTTAATAAGDGSGPAARDAVELADELAGSGLRTLLLAHASAPLTPEEEAAERPPAGLRAVVVLAFRESLRADAAQTMSYFRGQGVDVWILSGDHPRTVASVARAVGLDAGVGMDARELPEEPGEFSRAVLAHRVLGRVTPEQKRRIVHALRDAGHTVAMTGDGVNDALAVKDADLGIAMGSGSAATKAVARIVLLDDSFAHVPSVVAQGRQVIANIERVAVLFLAKTAYSMTISIMLGILAVQTPFLPRQLSVTDGLTIGIPAFFLALVPDARRYRPGFLRRAVGFALPNGAIVAACLLGLALVGDSAGLAIDEVRTATTLVLTAVGLWILVCQARPLSGWRIAVVLAMPVAAGVAYTMPWTLAFLAFAAPPAWFGALAAGVALAGCAAVELVHRLRTRSAPAT
ncbi:HAD-IC family P-type ATPase [Sinomonas sp. JGH33]|uniref:HAD-IC family P-type ATPase n=1 Tax=Sinomonas terricola TaxID=3110330 RepID=A0ABU5T0P3_9MICC|nr:HAD-IC family P-type ATPase [Sinomonas sp. JGH33]MEA5453226.1 HAD-IC family P-type ATPase [Sinomonas sp. JGH33]